jgi:hypothetical protein
MPPAGFEPVIPASERPQTNALDRAAAGIGSFKIFVIKKHIKFCSRNSDFYRLQKHVSLTFLFKFLILILCKILLWLLFFSSYLIYVHQTQRKGGY